MKPTLNSEAQARAWAWAVEHPDEVTHKALAEAGGVSSAGTAGKWLAAWRAELGDDLFRGEASTAREAQTVEARRQAEQVWAELREKEARNLGVTASNIRTRILEILPQVGGRWVDRGPDGMSPPVQVSGPGAREIKYLADAVGKLIETAELLEDRPTKHTRRSLPEGTLVPAGELAGTVDLSGLEESGAHTETRRAALAIVSRFKEAKAEVIDVQEAS